MPNRKHWEQKVMFRENTLLRKNRANQHWDVLGKQFDPKTIREKEAKVKLIGFFINREDNL